MFFSFLDRVDLIEKPDYMPSDADILRCRQQTYGIQKIEFKVKVRNENLLYVVINVTRNRKAPLVKGWELYETFDRFRKLSKLILRVI